MHTLVSSLPEKNLTKSYLQQTFNPSFPDEEKSWQLREKNNPKKATNHKYHRY